MRLQKLLALLACLLLAPATPLTAGAPDVAALLEEAKRPELAAQARALEGLVALGARAVPGLFERLAATPAANDVVVQNFATLAAQAAARPGNDAARAAMAGALLREARENRSPAARAFALELASYVAGLESVPALAALLRDDALADTALLTLARIPGQEAGKALAAASRTATGPLRVGLVNALAERTPGEEVMGALRHALTAGEEDVRIAARRSLSRMPRMDLEATLRQGLDHGTARERRMAADSLLAYADTLLAFRGAAASRARAISERIYRWALEQGPDDRIRVGGLEGLRRLGGSGLSGLLLRTATGPEGSVREAARGALAELPGATPEILRALGRVSAHHRPALIRVLGRRGDRTATPTLGAIARGADPEAAAAALEALGELRDPTSAPLLLEQAERGPEARRPLALAAYLAVLERTSDPARAREGYLQALRLAGSDEQRRAAVRGLGRLADPAVLPQLEALLDGPFRNEAADGVGRIGEQLVRTGDRERGILLLRRALVASTDQGLRRRLAGRLRAAGEDLDVAASSGFLTRWLALGPLPGRERWTRDDPFVPAELDVERAVEVDGQSLRWKPVTVTDPDGVLDLEQAVAQRGDAVAYLYAEVTSDRGQEVQLRIGSDDGFVLWVNGERRGEALVDRAFAPDQNSIAVPLRQGVNRILLKVTQGGGQWAAAVRVVSPSGTPLVLPQRRF